MQSFRAKEAKKPHRHRSPTPDSDTDSLNSTPRSPRHKSTPIRQAKASASAVNRRVMHLFNKNKNSLNEAAAATATTPTDYITTFVKHVEQDMRDQVKRHLHDEFMHDVQNLLWAVKKKPSIYVDLRTLPNYDPSLSVRSYQLFPDKRLDQIQTMITVKPQTTASASTSTAAAPPPPPQQVDSIELPEEEHFVNPGDVRVVKKMEKIDLNSNEVFGTVNANIKIVNQNDMFDMGNVDALVDLSMENDSHAFGSV